MKIRKILFVFFLTSLAITFGQKKKRRAHFIITSEFNHIIFEPNTILLNGIKKTLKTYLKPGNYSLLIKHPGYKTLKEKIYIPNGRGVYFVKKKMVPKQRLLLFFPLDMRKNISPKEIKLNGKNLNYPYKIFVMPGKYKVLISFGRYFRKIEKEIIVCPSENEIVFLYNPNRFEKYIRVLHSRFFDKKMRSRSIDGIHYDVNLYVDGKKVRYRKIEMTNRVVFIEFYAGRKIKNIQFAYAFYRTNENLMIFYEDDLEKLKNFTRKKRKLIYMNALFGDRDSYFKIRDFSKEKARDPLSLYIRGRKFVLRKFYYEIDSKLLIKHLRSISPNKRNKRMERLLGHYFDKKFLRRSLSLNDIKKISILLSDKKIIDRIKKIK